jgi:hypothetical protein
MAKTIFRQLLDLASQRNLRAIEKRHNKESGQEKITAWEQFVSMSFAQLTNCSGLREIETGLESISRKIYQLGIHKKISKSSLSRANNSRPSIIFQKFAYSLIDEAKEYYEQKFFYKKFSGIVYALDSTYISLCLSLCGWGQIGKQKIAGVKVHTLLNINTAIPQFIRVSSGSMSDCNAMDWITTEPGAYYVMDKAYVDFKRLNKINEAKGFFVVRFKNNIKFEKTFSRTFNRRNGVRADEVGCLTGTVGKKDYHDKIRKIIFYDRKKKKTLVFMTNNFSIKPHIIAELYKRRWMIEIFFKWIKQNLKIKKFFGNSLNAIETQIWIAISTYLLVMIAKKKLQLQKPLSQILYIISFSLIENTKLFQAVNYAPTPKRDTSLYKQLNLFN